MSELVVPRPGESVFVVFERSGERLVRGARVTEYSGNALRVTFDDGICPPGHTPVAVIAGTAENECFTPVRESVRIPGAMTLVLGTGWTSALNKRGMPRYPVFLNCRLESGASVENGVCVDISLTGAAVEVPEWSFDTFDLVLADAGEEVRMACDTVSNEQILGATVIHARFVDTDVAALQAIDRIVAAARDEFDEMQRLIARRADDPLWVSRSA